MPCVQISKAQSERCHHRTSFLLSLKKNPKKKKKSQTQPPLQISLNIWFLQVVVFWEKEKGREAPKIIKGHPTVLGRCTGPLKIYFGRKNYLKYLQITKSVLKYVWHIFNAFLTAGDMLEKFFELILNITLSLCDFLSVVCCNLFLKRQCRFLDVVKGIQNNFFAPCHCSKKRTLNSFKYICERLIPPMEFIHLLSLIIPEVSPINWQFSTEGKQNSFPDSKEL